MSSGLRKGDQVIIRREQPDDAEAVAAVHDAAFEGRGSHGAVEETRLVADLREAEDAVTRLCLVAVVDGEVVGHVMCSRGRVDAVPLLGLGPIGVLPDHQGSGVGSALMHAVVAAAEALEEPAIFLLGEPAYYGRFGFEPASAHGVEAPEADWGDSFQVRTFAGWDDACTGTFAYPPAFARL